MPLKTLLVTRLANDYPQFHFEADTVFRWLPQKKTIYFDAHSSHTSYLLHELAHAILNHGSYKRDIQLIEMERDAWHLATEVLAQQYEEHVDEALIEEALDSYRDWLHSRSTCPHCQAIGIQVAVSRYKCIACKATWKVNDARSCALRRYKT